MWTNGISHLFTNGVATIYALAAGIDLVGYRYIPARIRQWRHPRQFYRVTGVLQLITSLFLAVPQLRIWGIPLAGLITFVWVVTLLNHRQWSWAAAGMLLMMALVPASLTVY